MRALLGILDFVEFVATPIGLTASLWISLYFFLVNVVGYDFWWAALFPMIPALDLYLLLKESD